MDRRSFLQTATICLAGLSLKGLGHAGEVNAHKKIGDDTLAALKSLCLKSDYLLFMDADHREIEFRELLASPDFMRVMDEGGIRYSCLEMDRKHQPLLDAHRSGSKKGWEKEVRKPILHAYPDEREKYSEIYLQHTELCHGRGMFVLLLDKIPEDEEFKALQAYLAKYGQKEVEENGFRHVSEAEAEKLALRLSRLVKVDRPTVNRDMVDLMESRPGKKMLMLGLEHFEGKLAIDDLLRKKDRKVTTVALATHYHDIAAPILLRSKESKPDYYFILPSDEMAAYIKNKQKWLKTKPTKEELAKESLALVEKIIVNNSFLAERTEHRPPDLLPCKYDLETALGMVENNPAGFALCLENARKQLPKNRAPAYDLINDYLNAALAKTKAIPKGR